MDNIRLTKHFTLDQFLVSQTATRQGIDNTPKQEHVENLVWLCKKILDPIWHWKGTGVITSGYRSLELNKAINKGEGGSRTSQHCLGQAADFIVPGIGIEDLFLWLCSKDLPYDQVIQEFDCWIHISYSRDKQRRQKLRAIKENGKTKYLSA